MPSLARAGALLLTVVALCLADPAAAGIVCPDSSYCTVSFSNTYTGDWMTGQPYDYVTISPDGTGETFAETGIAIEVYLKNCVGDPLAGVPASEIVLFNSNLCICSGGNIADTSTDINGRTTFSGTIAAGGCVQGLDVFADGVNIARVYENGPPGVGTFVGSTIPVNTNSFDAAQFGASPCFVDSSDLTALAVLYGSIALYDICFDFNESGLTFDLTDLVLFAGALGAQCQ